MKVGELIRELKQFPDDWKVSLESYEFEKDKNGYVKHSLLGVEKDKDAKNYVVVR